MNRKSLIISLIVGSSFLIENLDSTVISTALPKMAESFHTNPIHLSAGISVYAIMLAVFIPVSGWISGRFGTRNVFGGAILGFVLSSVLCGISQNLPEFVGARVLQGIFGAMMVPVGRLSVLRNTKKEDLVTAIAYISWPGLIGPVIGPFLGGYITTYFSWRWIFFINVPLGLTAILLTWLFIPNTKSNEKVPLDWTGFALSTIALLSFMSGLEMITQGEISIYFCLALIVIGILFFIVELKHSNRIKFPLVDYKIIRVRTLKVTIYSGSIMRMVINCAPFLVPMMFQVGFGLDAFTSGKLFMASMVGNMATKPATIWITRKFNFKSVLTVNGVLLCLSTMATALLFPNSSTWMIVAVMFISGVFRSIQFSSLNTLAYADIPPDQMNNANTVYSTAQQLSLGLGITLGALCLHLANLIRGNSGTYDVGDFHLAFIIAGCFGFFSLFETLRLSKTDGNNVRGIK